MALLEARIERTSSSWLPFGVFDRFEGIPLCFTARTARRVASVYSPYPRIRNSGDARERRCPGKVELRRHCETYTHTHLYSIAEANGSEDYTMEAPTDVVYAVIHYTSSPV